jgi:hypothetical protein
MLKAFRVRKSSLNCENQLVFVFMFLLLFTFASYSREGEHAGGYDGKPAAETSTVRPKELDGVGIDEKLGSSVDLNLKLKNENGEEVGYSG